MLTILIAATLAAAQPAPASAAPDYGQDSNWLCLPGREDACGAPVATADLNPDGYGPVVQNRPAANAPIDCFFVYPTVSRDAGLNSDMDGQEERFATTILFARFASLCRPFAPMYRSVTNAGIAAFALGQDVLPNLAFAYEDVRSAWRQFLADRNNGRPFVLIGHSQGSIHLQRLIREEIEGKPIARQMVSAIIPGWNVEVPVGRSVGGTFRSTPVCTRIGQTGCIVSYVSFRAESPPPATGGLFGRAAREGMTVACTNPVTLAGGRSPLESYWFAQSVASNGVIWSTTGSPPAPFLHTRGLASAQCVHDGRAGYLAIRAEPDPADARTDRIPGDLVVMGRPAPEWGLHLIDIPAAQGDLIRLIEAQTAAFHDRRRRGVRR